LRDLGAKVVTGNMEDEYAKRARDEGFEVLKIVEKGDIILTLISNEVHPDAFGR